MVTIRTFDSAIEAHLLKSRLQHEGITSFILDENIVTLNPLYSNLVGGVKLKVYPDDEEAARRVVGELERTPLTRDDGTEVVCPTCGSRNYYEGYKSINDFKGVFAFLIALLFSVYPFIYKSVKKCKDCWREFS